MIQVRSDVGRVAGMLAIIFVSTVFLAGDFCEDVLSIPLEINYTSEPIDLTVDFKAYVDGGTDGDVDLDAEIPEGEHDAETDGEFVWDEDGYELSLEHMMIDFQDPDSGSAALEKYKGNLVGIFVRSVSYEIVNTTIPANIPPLKIFVAPEAQGDGSDGTYNWEASISSGELQDWINDGKLPSDGLGERGLVELGTTEDYIWDAPLPDFPTSERRLVRQTANIDEISDTVLAKFRFETIIIPTAKIVVDEADRDLIPDDLIGRLQVILHFNIVVIAKA
ncbi:MAG: hypothetical protein C4523_08305 [Myxococcales bacterium]|nr:MAG: hypothetical protein C4523_08305 [Myxococcales bacterium]